MDFVHPQCGVTSGFGGGELNWWPSDPNASSQQQRISNPQLLQGTWKINLHLKINPALQPNSHTITQFRKLLFNGPLQQYNYEIWNRCVEYSYRCRTENIAKSILWKASVFLVPIL